ncbi:hypothetical protein [Rivularia sp. UHCC 0363]|uniref:hypothetical protein n=1 Tax=Rivularia sp. UHCC 0363 TaxID=3110244 RepID=UPI002B21E661|nr:hypothetical protein [Rivularia sp. UHCC 0363]MEA5599453.1 hypothetical protein [Rivularia sp. UHCC 0363]
MRGKKDIESLQEQISKEINRRKNSKNFWCSISSGALKDINNRLERIKKILQISKYDILFIGQVGVGKTTAICHLFNLVYEHEEKKTIKSNDKVKSKTITSIKEILSTGSGKTTICEVIIKPASETYIEISPCSEEDMIELIREFCISIWQKVYPDYNSEYLLDLSSTELIRAIRNIVNLKESHKGNSRDQAEDLAKKFTQLDDFTNEVINCAKLSQRKETRINFIKGQNSTKENDIYTETIWIKDTFNEINLAKISTFSIPRKIVIYVSPNIIDFKLYPKFNSIIDTKGIDEVKNRKDLESYIRNKDQTICIFTESFKSAPSNVSELIARYLTSESEDIDTKFGLLILPQKGEPEKLLSSDGQVEDRDEGIAVRKSDIETKFRQQKIQFIPDNILFYDAKQFYLSDDIIDPNYETSDINLEKERLNNEINNLIERREKKLRAEVRKLKTIFLQIQNGNVLKSEDETLLLNLKKKIEEQNIIKYPSCNLTLRYIQSLKKHHVMVFRAINNRRGIYNLRDINIYFDCKNVAEDLVKVNLRKPKDEISGAIGLAKKEAIDKSILIPILEVIQNKVDTCYEEIVISLGNQISNKLKKEILKPQNESNPFWLEVKGRWGGGSGYRDDVLCMYENEMKGIDNFFRDEIQDLWQQQLRNNILSFFDEEDFE